MSINKNEIAETVSTFDQMMHVDENGKQYWNAHELSKALGYKDYYNFKPAIERAKDQMVNNNINPEDHLPKVREMVQIGSGAVRGVDGYKLTRRGAYTVAMNADPSKPEVAIAQEYFLQTTRKGEKAELIMKRLLDKETIDTRSDLKVANKQLNVTLLEHDVDADELGIVADAGDRGMFDQTTKQLKESNGIPDNRPVADFLGSEMATAKKFAQQLTRQDIIHNDKHGVDQCVDAAFENNRTIRNLVEEHYKDSPENLITNQDVKKVERKYNNFTQKQLAAIEQEF